VSAPSAYARLFAAHRVLLLGAGGGYDVLGGVPLHVELRARGIHVDFASVTFTAVESLPGAESHAAHECLYRLTGAHAISDAYCPEAWLARWLSAAEKVEEPVWAISKVGVRPLRAALTDLCSSLGTDLIVLVDGGIDLVLRGDETSIGTPSEDLATLAAVAGMPVESLAMCLGFGTELREGIPHAQVLERFSELQRLGAFLGAVSLEAASPGGAAYLAALDLIARGQDSQRGTHIHRTVVAAMRGEFGGEGDVWVSPLAALRWFFDTRGLASSHLFLRHLEETETMFEVTNIIRSCRKSLPVRPRTAIPL
jgi:hypothetical protein